MKEKTATIVGMGVSGIGAARLLGKNGWKVRVTEAQATPDIRAKAGPLERLGIAVETGSHTKSFIEGSRLVVTGPGVRADAAPLAWARALGIPVIDEIELGYRFCPAKIIAVTGTNGKSTTTTLIGELLKADKRDVIVCGNIGLSFCDEVQKAGKSSIVVLEVSSFQLQRCVRFRPFISLFLNISQNHLDRHKDFKEYLDAKMSIFKNQRKSDWAVINYDDRRLKNLKRHIRPRVVYFGNSIQEAEEIREFIRASDPALKEEHNLKNMMAAVTAANIFKVSPNAIKKTLNRFKGLEHRCEFVDEVDRVRFINDSKATTVDAAMNAIRSIQGPVILIAGGRDKGSDFTVLKSIIEQKVKAIVLIGEAMKKIRTQLMGSAPIYEARDMNEAVIRSFGLARERDTRDTRDTVLLSPMCASFDMFKNFEDRGEHFKEIVKNLKTQMRKEKNPGLTEQCRIQ
ncbi:MAG: UDP-N-acetylmuramoyl-L-alanine--D-glutamate ligase [Candidatus Omnitrophica bacterium]|nr:UDP-N-acetylmuramoyl-L-alanine--D-glutamate ligase [Candidatus Omnitrophota bacterium]